MTRGCKAEQATALEREIALYLAGRTDAPVRLAEIRSALLQGGYSSRRVARHDVSFATNDAPASTQSFVQKHTHLAEIDVMRLLQPIAASCALPCFIASGHDADGDWMLVPFIDGQRLDGEFSLPPDVVATLARVHTCFAEQLGDLAFLPRLDRRFWMSLLDTVEAALSVAP